MRTRILAILLLTLVVAGCGEDFMPDRYKEPYGNIEVYQRQLEQKLLMQYKNHPEFGKRVARVELVVSKDIETDVTGEFRKVEFSQLVYDRWNERIPELEQEYFVITFGPPGGPRRVHAPKLTVGLDSRGSYSEGLSPTPGGESSAQETKDSAEVHYCPVCGKKVIEAGICEDCLKEYGGQ